MVNPMRSNQNLRIFWKPVNLKDCVWENLHRIIMKTILQEKGVIHCNIAIWHTQFIPVLQAMDKEWEKLEKKFGVEPKKQVIDEARTKGAKVHFASLMDICHSENAEQTKHQKYQGRVVLRQYSLNKDHQHLK